MKDFKQLKNLVLEKVPLSSVLQDYGVEFMFSPEKAEEVQFRCLIHGRDNKPSARFYRSTQSAYCWFCQKRWDAITFTRDKESLSYKDALKFLIRKYKVDISGLPDTVVLDAPKTFVNPEELKVKEGIYLQSIKGKIREFRGKLPLEKYKALCYAYFMILYERSKGATVIDNLKKFESKVNGLTYAK